MKYFIRSLKYFVALCVICVAILALMLATGTSALTLDQTVYVMFHTSRYATLFAAIVVLAALYPRFGFVVRKVEGDVEENREQIVNAFKSAGFSLRGEEDGVMTFRADGPLRKGDEILSIDGRGWKSTHNGLARFAAASNAENRNYMTAMCMVCSHRDTAAVELVRDGRRLTERIATRSVMDWSPYITERMLDTANIRMVADGIGYMTGVNYTKADGARIIEKFRDTKALIVDLRCYPREFMNFDFIGRYFMPRTSQHVIWLAPTGALPGVFHELQDSLFVNPDNPAVAENPDYYKGRVIVLVDSSTQSQAEYTAMAFQATPRCTVVGTQTAGADGNISALVMPGGDFGYFSGLGVLYPDGTNTQRAGVRIDVPVYATVPGLQAGRDEILEKALEIIATGAYDPAAKI